MEMIDGKAVESWSTSDVAKVATELGFSLTAKEKTKVLELLCEKHDGSQARGLIRELVSAMKGGEAAEKPADQSAPSAQDVDEKSFRWYYHSKDRNETKAAMAAAVGSGRPVLLCACKPGCAVCDKVWKDELKAEKSFSEWMRKNRVVGLKVDDSSSHFTDLSKFKNKWTGIDGISGKKVNSTAPFFVFFGPSQKATSKSKITLDPDRNEVGVFLSGYGSGKITYKNCGMVAEWLEGVMDLAAFKKEFGR